jgi:hypothetical protein
VTVNVILPRFLLTGWSVALQGWEKMTMLALKLQLMGVSYAHEQRSKVVLFKRFPLRIQYSVRHKTSADPKNGRRTLGISCLNGNNWGGVFTGHTSYLYIFTYPKGHIFQYSATCPLASQSRNLQQAPLSYLFSWRATSFLIDPSLFRILC